MVGAEERLRAVDRQLLDLVDDLAAAVVAPARIALGVLVRRRRPDRLEHRRPGEVLGRDQLDLVALPLELPAEQLGDLGIDVRQAPRCGGRPAIPVRRPLSRSFPFSGGYFARPTRLPGRYASAACTRSIASPPGGGALADHGRLVAGEVDHGRGRPGQLAGVDHGRARARGAPRARLRRGAGRGRRGRWRSSPRRADRRQNTRRPAPAAPARERRSCPDASRSASGSAVPGSAARACTARAAARGRSCRCGREARARTRAAGRGRRRAVRSAAVSSLPFRR